MPREIESVTMDMELKCKLLIEPCRLTNRWEASLWLNGRQLYLGGFNSEEDAARAYDLVALACKGLHVTTNFGEGAYSDELILMKGNSQVGTSLRGKCQYYRCL